MIKFFQGGGLDPLVASNPEAKKLLARVLQLTTPLEAGRTSTNLTMSALGIHGVQQGNVTFADLMGTPGAERPFGGGLDPKTQQKAVKAHARSDALLANEQFRPGTKIQQAGEEHANRHILMAKAILAGQDFLDEAGLEKKFEEVARTIFHRG